jgi:hypothetical protein
LSLSPGLLRTLELNCTSKSSFTTSLQQKQQRLLAIPTAYAGQMQSKQQQQSQRLAQKHNPDVVRWTN